MENEKASEFIETITISDTYIRYHGEAYFIDGPIMFEPPVFKFRIYHMVYSEEYQCHVGEDFYTNYGLSPESCIKEFLKARIWEGKNFWEAEGEMWCINGPEDPLGTEGYDCKGIYRPETKKSDDSH
ncbi:MAG: hypothetical protein IJV69_01060 [Kiritimatiellae bacterium]|nr:hypothetical protein [Kiritimatiellia bacterium]